MVDQLYDRIFSQIPSLQTTRQETYQSLFDEKKEELAEDKTIRHVFPEVVNLPVTNATLWLEEMMASLEIPEINWKVEKKSINPEFFNVEQKLVRLQDQFKKSVSKEVYLEVTSFIEEKVDKKFRAIDNSFDHYYRSIPHFNDQFYKKLASVGIESLYDEFMKKISPGLIAMDFRVIWTFEDIEKEYNGLLGQLLTGNHGYVFNRYFFNEELFQYVGSSLSYRMIEELIPLLKDYAGRLQKVESYIDEVESDDLEKMLKKLIEACSHRFEKSIIDFEGFEEVEIQLISAVQTAWERLFNSFEEALGELNSTYNYVLLSLFGGLFMHSSLDFRSLGLKVHAITLSPIKLDVQYEEGKIDSRVIDFIKAIEMISEFRARGDLKAVNYSEMICQKVETDDIIKARNVSPFGSAVYVANLYKYATTASNLSEIQLDEFVTGYEELYSSLSVIIKDEDVQAVGAPLQSELLYKYLHFIGQMKSENRMKILFDYAMRMITRFERGLLYQGEDIADDDYFYSLLVLAAQYCKAKRVKHPFINICDFHDLSNNIIDNVLNHYYLQMGSDSFYKHFHASFATKLVQLVTGSKRKMF